VKTYQVTTVCCVYAAVARSFGSGSVWNGREKKSAACALDVPGLPQATVLRLSCLNIRHICRT